MTHGYESENGNLVESALYLNKLSITYGPLIIIHKLWIITIPAFNSLSVKEVEKLFKSIDIGSKIVYDYGQK